MLRGLTGVNADVFMWVEQTVGALVDASPKPPPADAHATKPLTFCKLSVALRPEAWATGCVCKPYFISEECRGYKCKHARHHLVFTALMSLLIDAVAISSSALKASLYCSKLAAIVDFCPAVLRSIFNQH